MQPLTELSVEQYHDFLDYWDEHDPDLTEAVRGIVNRCEETWKPRVGVLEIVCLEKLCRFMARLVGEIAVARLFLQREELLADEAFRCEVGATLWKAVDAAPETGLGAIFYESRHDPTMAPHWKECMRDRAARRERYAQRARAVQAARGSVADSLLAT